LSLKLTHRGLPSPCPVPLLLSLLTAPSVLPSLSGQDQLAAGWLLQQSDYCHDELPVRALYFLRNNSVLSKPARPQQRAHAHSRHLSLSLSRKCFFRVRRSSPNPEKCERATNDACWRETR
jgi:hypothetical protein